MQWQYGSVYVSDLWRRAKVGDIEPYILARKLAARVKAAVPENDRLGLTAILTALEGMSEKDDFDDFDILYERLCDWADYGHRLFINTFTPLPQAAGMEVQ